MVAQLVKKPPAMQETQVQSLGWEDPLETGNPVQCSWGFPGGSQGEESACNAGKPWFDPWVGKVPWRKAWQPTPIFLPGESPWTEEPDGLQSMGLQRVGYN